jgi:hypothetical protein
VDGPNDGDRDVSPPSPCSFASKRVIVVLELVYDSGQSGRIDRFREPPGL